MVVFTGDGGFQMIASAFSTLVRHQRPDIVFVFDNRLYGIEQFLMMRTSTRTPRRTRSFLIGYRTGIM